MIEETACDGTQNTVAHDHQHGGGFASVVGQGVDISVIGTFDQAMSSEFAQIVSELVAGVLRGCEVMGLQDGLMEIGGAEAADVR